MRTRFLIIFIAAGILCFWGSVNAQTIGEQLQSQLQAQIAQLQAQLQAMVSQQQGSVQWCYNFNSNLGSATLDSSAITALHTALQKENISYEPDSGETYSDGTSQAVVQFQAKYGIAPQSGYVGPLTRAKLNSLYGCSLAPATPAPVPSVPAGPLTGSINLSKNTVYGNQSISAPRTKFKLADFVLKNNTTETVNIKTIEADLNFGYFDSSYVNNLYIVYGENTSPAKYLTNYKNYWSVDFQLPSAQSISVALYGDINTMVPMGTAINTSMLISGTTINSGVDVHTNSNAVYKGQSISVAKKSFAATAVSSSSAVKLSEISQKIAVGGFKFTSTNDSYSISELKFIVPDLSVLSPISDVFLSDSTTKEVLTKNPVTMTHDGNRYVFDFTNLNIPVGLNSSKSITISYDFGSVIYMGNTNKNIAPVLIYVKALDSSGNPVDGIAANYSVYGAVYYNGVTLPAAGATVSSLYVFKGVPAIAGDSESLKTGPGSGVNLYTFKISAGPKGDVSIKQLRFAITISDPNKKFPNVKNLSLFKGDADYTWSVMMGEIANNNYISVSCCENNAIGLGTNSIIVAFNTEEIIPAGTTNTYTLKGDINNFYNGAKGPAKISISIPSDKASSISGNYLRAVSTPVYGLSLSPAGFDINTTYNLLWSDKGSTSFPPHSDLNGSATSDWYDGFGVSGLPTAVRTITAK